jgi:hypothetical protein
MNDRTQNGFSNGEHAGMSEAEETLRLIARLPAPDGLEKRVQAGLAARQFSDGGTARVLDWPTALRPSSSWMRAAAAAAIVFVVVGGGWGVYSRVQPPQGAKIIVMPRVGSPSGFSNAGAIRTPHTLNGQPKKPVRRTASAMTKKAPVQPAAAAK